MDVGNRIKQLREQNKYSQNYLADIAGISQTHLRRVELGTADITVGHLQLVCDALGISLKDFFNVSEEQEDISSAISNLTPKQRNLLLEFLKSV
ncbi:TPA: helix-turn-helix transcriptional regulator [Candidatus Scatousia excrementigallinarum]|uniref:Helix-turn-helix transcriptional regulator n=1 Tax=Candidatus Scatousia excrementigallinarum TaxID=2840935 RepID=A0A9D1JMF1_9BACT|nr:helix-turn-helix transcriptional regulator [Candidatus Scatousia excrementigallinarum]